MKHLFIINDTTISEEQKRRIKDRLVEQLETDEVIVIFGNAQYHKIETPD